MLDSRKALTATLLELARNDKNIIAVTTDARGSVTLCDFANELPDQFVECGIAEQNAVGISAGLAHSGKKVFCCGPACFYVARALEQVKVDLAYSGNPVKIVGVSGGFAYGALGATHHSLHDIAVLRAFPGMRIIIPSDAHMAAEVVKSVVDLPFPVYIRIGRGATGEIYNEGSCHFELGKANIIHEGCDLSIVATGEAVYHSLQASKMLEEKGIHARVLDFTSIKPFDAEALHQAAEETGMIITVEEHSRFGGLGALVVEELAETPVPVKILGVPDENIINAMSAQLYSHYGLDGAGIATAAEEFYKSHIL